MVIPSSFGVKSEGMNLLGQEYFPSIAITNTADEMPRWNAKTQIY